MTKTAEFFRYIGPGVLVTVGFIDPGNWASNVAAGASYGYTLLWIVTLSTLMLIILQHNVAHLGIATGLCLSEAATVYLRPEFARTVLATAVLAAVATALAEILGAAIALQMLFGVPLKMGALATAMIAGYMLYSNSYRRLEKWIIGFVSLIGFSFIYELSLVDVAWREAAVGWVVPAIPVGAMPIVMSVLGAVVMPHNLFLHSEVIQSRQWNLENPEVIKRQLRYEFLDTLFSMGLGWAINSAMLIVAAATFFSQGIQVDQLEEAVSLLKPLLGNAAYIVFAIALLFAGLSSSVTAGMAGGSIFAGIFGKAYEITDRQTKTGVGITFSAALIAILFITDPFKGLVVSQMLLSIQLPLTIFLQIKLTSSHKVMGSYANSPTGNSILICIAIVVAILNIMLLFSYLNLN